MTTLNTRDKLLGLQQRIFDGSVGVILAGPAWRQGQRGDGVVVVRRDHRGHCSHLRTHRLPLAAKHPPPVAAEER